MRRPWLVALGIFIIVLLGGATLMRNDYLGWSWPSPGWAYRGPILYFGSGLALVAIGWWPDGTVPRVLMGVVGLAAFVYGIASITGGWLGTAPWQLREVDRLYWLTQNPDAISPSILGDSRSTIVVRDAGGVRGFLSVVLAAAGATLIAVALWPRWETTPTRALGSRGSGSGPSRGLREGHAG